MRPELDFSGRLTCWVFNQNIHVLVHVHLEWTVLGVLGLIGSDAAVSLGDERVSDVSTLSAGEAGTIR